MKKCIILFVLLIMFTSLSACSQNEFSSTTDTNKDRQTSSDQVNSDQKLNDSLESASSVQELSKRVLVFDSSLTDPQDMTPTYVNGVCKVLSVFEEDAEGYIGEVEITRRYLQGNDETLSKNQFDSYMMLSYKSKLAGQSGMDKLPAEAKNTLDELASNDKGQKFYGILSTTTHLEQFYVDSTFDFNIPFNYKKSNSDTLDIPYILSVNGNNTKLYMYLHKLAVVQVDGEINNLPITSPIIAKTDAELLYINDKGFSPEYDKLQDLWHMLFLGKKEGDFFNGHLYLSRIEQKYGAIPGALSLTGNSEQYEDEIELFFQPFDEENYRNAGGQMGSMHIASLSHMATVNCHGINVLFTAASDVVYVELPGSSFQGSFEGKFTDNDGEAEQIYEESLNLCYAEMNYSTVSRKKSDYDFDFEAALQGAENAGITLTESQLDMIRELEAEANSFVDELEGQCLWLPPGFLPMTSPVEFIEQNVMTAPVFSYIEENLWLDTIGPIYSQRFEKMRDFSVQEGDIGGHYYMEIVFSYGGKAFYIELTDTISGTDIDVMVFGQ